MMRPTLFLVAVLPFVTPVFSSAETCQEIASKVTSASDVIYACESTVSCKQIQDELMQAVHPNFLSDIHHWYISSSQTPSCVFEPGSAEDLATAVSYTCSRVGLILTMKYRCKSSVLLEPRLRSDRADMRPILAFQARPGFTSP